MRALHVLLLLTLQLAITSSRTHIQLHEQEEEWSPSPYPRVKANTAIFFMGDSTSERVYKYGMLGEL